MKFKTLYNRSEFPPDPGESLDPISLTVPDQSMSVEEIIRRTKAGLPLSGARVPQYHDEDFSMDPGFMDTIDKLELAYENRLKMEEMRNNASQEHHGKRAEKRKAYMDKLKAEKEELERLRALHSKQGESPNPITE
jgi:hypothetical protein